MPCVMCGKDSGKFYEGSCPECLMGRVQELEQRVVDMRDRVLLERERREQVEAQAAAMRDVLELSDYKGERLGIVAGEDRPVRLLCEQYGYGAVMDSAARQWRNKLGEYGDGALMVGHSAAVVRSALSATAGKELLDQVEKLERLAEAARKTTVLVVDDAEGLVQTVRYTCGCFALVEEDAESPQTKCPHCELVDALEALGGDGNG